MKQMITLNYNSAIKNDGRQTDEGTLKIQNHFSRPY